MKLSALLFILCICTSFAATASPSIDQFNAYLQKVEELGPGHAKLGLRNGVVSLVFAMKKRREFDTYAQIIGHQFSVRQLSTDFFGRALNVRYAHSVPKPTAPTVLLHAGFVSDFSSGAVGYFIDGLARNFRDYNVIVVEGFSSRDFARQNNFYSLGGIHEPYLIRAVLEDFWKTNRIQDHRTLLVGGSSASFSVAAAPVLINRSHPDKPVVGSFLMSGHNSMSAIYRRFEAAAKGNTVRHDPLTLKFGFKKMSEKFGTGKETPFAALMAQTFEDHRVQLEQAWADLYGTPNGGRTLGEWVEDLSLSKFQSRIDTPFYWLQAKNDPMPGEGEYERFRKEARDNPWISGEFRDYGGHAAFDFVYGREWLWQRMKLFAESMLAR